jgi:predicted transcriptional regulator
MMANTPLAAGRHSILELAPLELDCMNALWPLGEATVRDIQQALALTRPRAYTTIMTIMDRLAHKGTVVRQKGGRAWVYRPNLSADEARSHAIAQVVDGFFEGSADALTVHLLTKGGSIQVPSNRKPEHLQPVVSDVERKPDLRDKSSNAVDETLPTPLDTSLL